MTYPALHIAPLLAERKIEWVLRAWLPGLLAELAAQWGPQIGMDDSGAFFSPPREIHHTSLRGVTIGDDALWQATPVVCVAPGSSLISGQQNNAQTDVIQCDVEVYVQSDGIPFSSIPGLSRAYCNAVVEALVRHLPDSTTQAEPCTGIYLCRATQSAVGDIIRVGDTTNMVTARAAFELQRRASLTTGRSVADSLPARPHWPEETDSLLLAMPYSADADDGLWSPFVPIEIPVGTSTLTVEHPAITVGSSVVARRQAMPTRVTGTMTAGMGGVTSTLDISTLTTVPGDLTVTLQDAVTGATIVYLARIQESPS